MYYLQRLAGEDSQTEQAAGDSDDEISELDPSLYGVPQAVEHDKSCQSTRSFLSPHVLITLEEIDAIINAGNLTDISLKDSSETPTVDKDDELIRASAAGGRPGEANHTGTTATATATATAKENSALRKAYYRMRAIFLTDTGQRQSADDHEDADADNSSSSYIWKLLKLQLLPAMTKRGGAAGGRGGEGEKSAAKEGGILISYSTELDDLSKFYSIPNADKFSISSTELRSLRCFLHFMSCYYHASSIRCVSLRRRNGRSSQVRTNLIMDQMMKSTQPTCWKSSSSGTASTAPSTALLVSRTASGSSASLLLIRSQGSSMNTNTEKSATSSLRTSNDSESDRYYMNMKVPAEESTIIAKSHGRYGMLCRILSFYLY
jgi:hypothetical protein